MESEMNLREAAAAALNAWEIDHECRWHMDNLRAALAEPDDTALLRQALEWLELRLPPYPHKAEGSISRLVEALRERLGEKA